MTLKALFSKKERTRLDEMAKAEAEAKAKAEAEEREREIRTSPDIAAFVTWYEDQVKGKSDKDVNYVEVGYLAQDKLWSLTLRYPELPRMIGEENPLPSYERRYCWLDDEACWHSYNLEEMRKHYARFVEQEKEHNFYGDYVLEKIGPLGGGPEYAYEAIAYLSYAYYEQSRWKRIVRSLAKLIA